MREWSVIFVGVLAGIENTYKCKCIHMHSHTHTHTHSRRLAVSQKASPSSSSALQSALHTFLRALFD